jgi:hypothetical protein
MKQRMIDARARSRTVYASRGYETITGGTAKNSEKTAGNER